MGVDHQASVGLVAIPVGLGVPCWGSDLVSIRPVLVSCPPLALDTVPGLEPCLPELAAASKSSDWQLCQGLLPLRHPIFVWI